MGAICFAIPAGEQHRELIHLEVFEAVRIDHSKARLTFIIDPYFLSVEVVFVSVVADW